MYCARVTTPTPTSTPNPPTPKPNPYYRRCSDSTTGQTYHPVYAPAPPEVHPRLVWRLDDSTEVLTKRITEHRASCEAIVGTFEKVLAAPSLYLFN